MNQNTPPIPSQHDADEIDLFELFESIWQAKWLIVAITVVITGIAVVYALLATPVYETSSILRPAQQKDLDSLNITEVYSLTPEEALALVGASLESYDSRFAYFKKHPELFEEYIQPDESLEQSFERFNRDAVTILRPDEKRDDSFSKYVGIQVQYPRGVDGPAITNGFVRAAIDIERERLQENVDVLIENRLDKLNRELSVLRTEYNTNKEARIKALTESDNLKRLNLNDELEALRLSLERGRENRIQQLTEAIAIAQSLGIKKPTTPSNLDREETRISGSVIKTEVNNQQIPLYFMGTDALEAERTILLAREDDDFTSGRIVEIKSELKRLENNREIEILNTRENEDLFLEKLAEKRSEITRLNEIKLNMDRIQLVTIDQIATQPRSPIKPKKVLIVLVGGVLGGMLGVFVALVLSMVRKRREQLGTN